MRLGRLIVLAAIGFGAALALAGLPARGAAVRRARPSSLEAQLLTDLSAMDADRLERLCAAYYEAHRFRVKPVRWRSGEREAELYFGTLAEPVALLRCLCAHRAAADVDAIRDLPDMLAARGIARAIVHSTGGYTERASAYARRAHIRLVTAEDFVRSITDMADDAQARLSAMVRDDGEANVRHEATLS